MELFTTEQLRTLMAAQEGPCVSIYQPTHRIPMEIQQDRIRFKNLLKEAQDALIGLGLRRPEAEALLEPADRLVMGTQFWKGQKDGLALFLTGKSFHSFILPLEVPELLVVGDRFHVKPLISLLMEGEFYLLALSQNEVRFFQASRYSISEIDLAGVPRSLSEALKYDEPEKQLQFHTRTQKVTGDRAAMFHGHGVGHDDAKSNLLRFCQQISRGLHEILRNERAPLVLAGVDFLLPIYREANSYAHLLPEWVSGNPEGKSPEALQRQAWPLVEPVFLETRREAAARYREMGGTNRVSHDLKEIVPAAYHGRVETLFVTVGRQRWGSYNPKSNEVSLAPGPEPGAEDLLDFVAVQTLLQGGTVFPEVPAAVSEDQPAAALFRY